MPLNLFGAKPKKRRRRKTTKTSAVRRRRSSSSTRTRRRTSRTRRTSARTKALRKLRIFLIGFFSALVAILVLLGVAVYKFIHAPFTSASTAEYSNTDLVWSNKSTNLLIVKVDNSDDKYSEINKLFLVNFDKDNYHYSIYEIPTGEEIEYALNYGSGPLSRVYAVGNADEERGVYLLKKTILKQLAIKADGYIIVDNKGFDAIQEVIGEINPEDLSATLRLKNLPKIPSLIATFRKNAVTDLKLADIYSVFTFIRKTSETSSENTEITIYQLIEPEKWDDLWQGRLNTSEFKKEGIKVFIANGSENPRIPGLASWGSRVVENLGGVVLDTQNSFAVFDESVIITEDPDLTTVKELAATLEITNIININDLDKSQRYNPQIERTPVSLILTDY